MHGEDLLVDDGSNWKAVEAVSEGLPQLDVVTALALVVKAVDAVDRGALAIASQNEEVLGVLDLVREEKAYGFQRLLATIDVVAQEEVVRLRREAAVLEETEQVIVLAVDIAADLGWGRIGFSLGDATSDGRMGGVHCLEKGTETGCVIP